MPVGTSSLSIKALPLEAINKEHNVNASQILSPSSILPTTALFTLLITTNASTRLTYEINVQQSNNLMQKSALFNDLSTQYDHYASQTSLNLSKDNLTNPSGSFNNSSLEELIQKSNGLPMFCIELPNISTKIIDDLLQWLSKSDDNDMLTSTLASDVRSTFDFFSLLNFATLLDLFEPYCSVIDEILVWYYFGLNEHERNLEILKNESFIEGIIPARFVKRLAESINESEEKLILSSFFREKISSEETRSTKEDSSVGGVKEGINDTVTQALNRLPDSSPLDIAEPPTPLGSAYFCLPPNTPSSPMFQRILPRTFPRTPKTATYPNFIFSPSSMNEKNDIFEEIPLTAGLSVSPKTSHSSVPTTVPPNTPISPANNIVPPNSPATPLFYSPLAPPNTPNTPIPSISSPSYSAITINGLLSPTLIPISPSSTPITAPPNTPTSPFIFHNSNKFPRRISHERNVTINSALANSLSSLYDCISDGKAESPKIVIDF